MPDALSPTSQDVPTHARLEQAVQTIAQPNPLLPLVMHTLARGLQGADNKGDLDAVFDQAMQRHPNASRELLSQFVADYQALPVSTRARIEPEGLHNLDITQPVSQPVIDMAANLTRSTSDTAPNVTRATDVPIGGGIYSINPTITAIEPANPKPQQAITIVGTGFGTDSTVGFYAFDPDHDQLIAWVTPVAVTPTSLAVQLPLQVGSSVNYILVHCTNNGQMKQSNLHLVHVGAISGPPSPPPPPTPVITNISTQLYPGKYIMINGLNLFAVKYVIFRALDPLNNVGQVWLPSASYQPIVGKGDITARTPDGKQLDVLLPPGLPPGRYQLSARTGAGFDVEGAPRIESNWVECQVLPYHYRVTFTDFQCLKPWGMLDFTGGLNTDQLITMWAVTHDNLGYFKSTPVIETDAGQAHSYGGNGLIFPPDGDDGALGRVLAIQNQLFFAGNGYDPQSTIETIGAVGNIAVGAATALGQPEIALLAEFLTPIMQALINALVPASDPGLAWPLSETIGWSVAELQSKTNNPQRMFQGQVELSYGRGGNSAFDYILHYQVARIEGELRGL